ncbi:ATPase [Solibacillus sp. FSL W7-1464]|uniref:ATPase n=1 Tax=Solibacillus sp. FSL W7-1464 TaxID=2921706 RepID=UPI0030FAF61E
MGKVFWIPLLASFATIAVLYFIGYLADINFLIFKISLSYTEIALLPIFVGAAVGIITEWMLKRKAGVVK